MIRIYNKKFIIITILTICAGGVISLVYFFHGNQGTASESDTEPKKLVGSKYVYVDYWNDVNREYPIAIIKKTDYEYEDWYDFCVSFNTEKSVDDLGYKKEDYIGDIDFWDDGIKTDAKLFYRDNNYFVLIGNCYAMNCCGIIENGYKDNIYFPLPVRTLLDYNSAALRRSRGENLAADLFENISFEQACEFYSRMSDDYVEIDKENMLIVVDAYYRLNEKLLDKYITLDWMNKKYVYEDILTGELIEFDGNPPKEIQYAKRIKPIKPVGLYENNIPKYIFKTGLDDSIEYNYDDFEVYVNTVAKDEKVRTYDDNIDVDTMDILYGEQVIEDMSVIFVQNNYYGLFFDEKKNQHVITGLVGEVVCEDRKLNFVMPGRISINHNYDKSETVKNIIDDFFGMVGFDDAMEFYNRFTNDCADIDKDNQTITVDGYDRANDEYIEDFITIDWKNKMFTYKAPDSTEKVVYKG